MGSQPEERKSELSDSQCDEKAAPITTPSTATLTTKGSRTSSSSIVPTTAVTLAKNDVLNATQNQVAQQQQQQQQAIDVNTALMLQVQQQEQARQVQALLGTQPALAQAQAQLMSMGYQNFAPLNLTHQPIVAAPVTSPMTQLVMPMNPISQMINGHHHPQQQQPSQQQQLDPNLFGTLNSLHPQPITSAMYAHGNAGTTAGVTANANSTANANVNTNVSCVPLASPLTVQDRPHHTPIYNGVNPNYPNLQVLHQNPPIFAVPGFLTPTECDFLICVSQDCFSPAPVVGKGAGEVSPSRTSSTCYLAREDLPEYIRKVSALTGKPMEHCELPQVGRYFPSQQYLQHFDAFDLSNEDGRRFASNGGQRTVTILVYLNDVERGGHTAFPTLNLEVKPRKGMALVFFPATVDGALDKNALHAAKPAIDTKYVSQVWIRQGRYEGLPSKRIFSNVEQASIVQKSLICAREGGALNANFVSNMDPGTNVHNHLDINGTTTNGGDNADRNTDIAKQ